MRFSLGTLVLVVLFTASFVNLWFSPREPWFLAEKLPFEAGIKFGVGRSRVSPDGLRKLENLDVEDSGSRTFVCDMKGQSLQYIHANSVMWEDVSDSFFISDDCIIHAVEWTTDFGTVKKVPGVVRVFRRRFPEWWWGHFYRPEVWACLALGIALIVRAWRSRRRRVVES